MTLKASPFLNRGSERPSVHVIVMDSTLKECPRIMLGDAFSVGEIGHSHSSRRSYGHCGLMNVDAFSVLP